MQLSIKRLFSAGLGVVVGLLGLAGWGVYNLGQALQEATQANTSRYNSYLLADELRQSSDDLTRLARTYVVTGDTRWEQQYMEILDVRNGKTARPNGYEKIYWDFRAAGIDSGRGQGQTVALNTLMEQAGFTPREFDLLHQAEAQSNALVKLETSAMNMVKGLYDDGQGNYTVKKEPDLAQARSVMHGADYHAIKAKIMKPVDDFLTALDERTAGAVAAAEKKRQTWFTVLEIIGVVMLLVLMATLWYMFHHIMQSLRTAVIASDQMAQGDLSHEVPTHGLTEVSRLLMSLSAMRENLMGLVASVRGNAESVAAASAQIAQGNNDLSSRTEQQASALEETAASMEELSSTVRQNAENAQQANQMAMQASSVASEGGQVVNRVVETMKEINTSSQRISDIISVIDSIAFQTNILALNAAVEAARAGEQGRGFAVVAGEVRNLAGRCAQAAKEIKQLIADSVERVGQGTALVDQAGTTMVQVVESIRRVTDIMGEISAASSQQSMGVAQVGEAVTQMDQATQQNAALVEESAAAASNLQVQAQKLVEVVSVFKLQTAGHAPLQTMPATVASHAQAAASQSNHRPRPSMSTGAGKTSAAPKPKAKITTPPQTKMAHAGQEDWETF